MSEQPKEQARKIDPAKVKAALKSTVELVRKLGVGASDLFKKLMKDKSPQAMLKTIEDSQLANQARREVVSARVEKLHGEIVQKKKAYESAPPARKRILEAELQSKLAEYKAGERELTVLLENERLLSQVKGRLNELTGYTMAGVSEIQIDDVIDEIEEAVSEAEGRVDAARDLEKAGRRRERESDRENLLDELKGFEGESESSVVSKELEGFDDASPAKDKPSAKSKVKEQEG